MARTKRPTFIVYFDHVAGFDHLDKYVELKGDSFLEAMIDFRNRFDGYKTFEEEHIYHVKMYQFLLRETGLKTDLYCEVAFNTGHGWNPIELRNNHCRRTSYGNIYHC